MILYTVNDGNFYNLFDFKKDLSDLKENGFRNQIYINFTNRCTNRCTFCLRPTKKMDEHNSLWLSKEPESEEIIDLLKNFDIQNVKEIVCCGFGEPSLRIDTVLEVASYIKEIAPHIPVRINTNGQGELAYGKEFLPRFQGLINVVSISLNASTKEEYQRICLSKYGEAAFDELLRFAVEAKKYVDKVVLSVVDNISKEEIEACRKICEDRGLTYRIRPFEE